MSNSLIQMAGHAGSGKSTLALAIANRTGGVVLDLDTIKTALLESDIAWSESSAASYAVIYSLVDDLLATSCVPIIVDTPSYWTEIHERLTAAVDACGADYRFVECVADEAVRARRLIERPTQRSQIRELGVNAADAPAATDAVHLRAIQRPDGRACLSIDCNGDVDVDVVLGELGLASHRGPGVR